MRLGNNNYSIYFTGRGLPEPFFVAANKSAEFNNRILEAIAKCQPGTTIVVDEIIVTNKEIQESQCHLLLSISIKSKH